MHTHKELLEAFGKDRTKYVVRFNPADIVTKNFMFKTHRAFVEHLFKSEHRMKVIQHHHCYSPEGKVQTCGLIYSRTDSDIYPMIEVYGIEGVSVTNVSEA